MVKYSMRISVRGRQVRLPVSVEVAQFQYSRLLQSIPAVNVVSISKLFREERATTHPNFSGVEAILRELQTALAYFKS